ncbi:MAG: ABC transporter permease [Patescibacteria group bacterium]|jgi:putative ABC transport system permease protein|nr:ABC transporter permease [Patescibacteria group bacterium]
MNKIVIALQLALKSLSQNILRTSLTVLGVIIGAASIIMVFFAGDALNSIIAGEVNSYGSDVIQTEIKVPSTKNSFQVGEVTTLKMGDFEEINKLDNIVDGYAASLGQKRVSYGAEGTNTFIFGVGQSYINIDRKSIISEGRFFTEGENESQATVAVIGYKLKEDLFGNSEAVGKMLRLGTFNYRVIGVLEEQSGAFNFIDFDEIVYVPVNTLQKRILGVDYSMYFIHQLKDLNRAEDTAEEIKYLLRERHEITNPDYDDFRVSTMEEIVDTLGVVTSAVTFLLLGIVLISLLVGGVGIMNIMYVTVTERTPEIGLRKAMGAKPTDITWQFLIESVLITFWGWLIGVVVGVIGSFVIYKLALAYNLKIAFLFPWQGILVSFVFSIICGLLFGFQPAKRASKLDPVEALRTE